MRAFHYCPVSTKEQGTQDHYSLSNQKQRYRDYSFDTTPQWARPCSGWQLSSHNSHER